jgi:hypothetical protein
MPNLALRVPAQEGVTSQAVPLRRTRCAWNKGMKLPEATRLKISAAQKRRWKDPGLRARMAATFQACAAHGLHAATMLTCFSSVRACQAPEATMALPPCGWVRSYAQICHCPLPHLCMPGHVER